MKKETPIVLHTPKQKEYIKNLPIPGRQGDYKYNPVHKITKFTKSKIPNKLFDSMDDVSVRIEQISVETLCGWNCINIQRDVELHKGKLLSYLISKEVNFSTMTTISAAYIRETGEYLINDGNTRLAVCRDELLREIDELKKRRFKIPEYFNVIVHEYETQVLGEQAYKTYDNSNAVETPKQKLQGALYASGHTDWLSHGILGHCSYFNAMQDLLALNGVKNAAKLDVFDLLDFFEDDITHFYKTFDYKFKTHASTRFIMAYLGLRLGYKEDANKMYPKIDAFFHKAATTDILKQGLGGGAGMFHNEFLHKVIYDCRYLRKEMHVTTNPKLTFGLMLNYFNGWNSGAEYTKRIPDKSETLENQTHVFFRGEDGATFISFK